MIEMKMMNTQILQVVVYEWWYMKTQKHSFGTI